MQDQELTKIHKQILKMFEKNPKQFFIPADFTLLGLDRILAVEYLNKLVKLQYLKKEELNFVKRKIIRFGRTKKKIGEHENELQ